MLESTWKQGSDAQRELFHVLDSPNLDVNLEWETFLKAKHNMFDETAKKFALDQTINKSIEFHKWNQNCRMVKARNTHLPSMCGWAVETQNGLVPCKSENAKTEWPK